MPRIPTNDDYRHWPWEIIEASAKPQFSLGEVLDLIGVPQRIQNPVQFQPFGEVCSYCNGWGYKSSISHPEFKSQCPQCHGLGYTSHE